MGGAEGGTGSIAFGISSLLEKPTPIMFCHLEVLMLSSTRFTEDFAYEVLSVVEEIPEGNVATYGQIARLIGRDKNSRLVARVLSHASNYGDFPCHRCSFSRKMQNIFASFAKTYFKNRKRTF